MRTFRGISAVLLANLVAMAALGGGASASEHGNATCTTRGETVWQPGLEVRKTSGTFRSSGLRLDCAGSVGRARFAPGGTLKLKGRYHEGTCLDARGTGRFSGSIETITPLGGKVWFHGRYTWKRIGGVRSLTGKGFAQISQSSLFSFGGQDMSDEFPIMFNATGASVPTTGDCASSPVETTLGAERISLRA